MDDRELLGRIAEKVGKIDVLVEAQKRLEENQAKMELAIGKMADAVEEALKSGLYFDVVKKGIDCECCGDRWDGRPDEYDTLYDISECVSIANSKPVYVHQRDMIVDKY